MTCREAIQAVFAEEDGVLTKQDVIDRLNARHPDQAWKPSTIGGHLVGMSVNHPSSHHYTWLRSHAMLFSLGNGRFRRWDPEQDGTWVQTEAGVQLADEAMSATVEDEIEAAAASLSLERDLEDCLVGNLHQLEPGLSLYESDGIRGQQLDTGIVGRLDLLAEDEGGDLVVIELKVGRAEDKVCGQLLRYMGWVGRELADGRRVRGIIVASEFSDGLRYAAQAVPNVELRRYEVRFAFSEVGFGAP